MKDDPLHDDYKAKPNLYYEQSRPEMVSFIPDFCKRVLDVGCGDGSFGALLKHARGIEVHGVEPFMAAAELAAKRLDRVIHGPFNKETPLPLGAFDCVVFNDVLEHLVDPASALRHACTLLSPKGVIVASIPNIQHFPTIWRLVVHGEWQYRDCGTLDKTHMRFFTRSSIISLFGESGLIIDQISGMHPYRGVPNASVRVWRAYKIINALSGGHFSDMRFERFGLVARAFSDGSL